MPLGRIALTGWETLVQEALLGDDDALALLTDDARPVVRRARDLFRDGHTSDTQIAELIATIEPGRPERLH